LYSNPPFSGLLYSIPVVEDTVLAAPFLEQDDTRPIAIKAKRKKVVNFIALSSLFKLSIIFNQ
jgi:hypothetical protein